MDEELAVKCVTYKEFEDLMKILKTDQETFRSLKKAREFNPDSVCYRVEADFGPGLGTPKEPRIELLGFCDENWYNDNDIPVLTFQEALERFDPSAEMEDSEEMSLFLLSVREA